MLNYVLTRIVVQSMSRKIGRNYAAIAQVTGVLENVKQELYQAVARPLEDRKKLANGDCYKELQ